LAKWQRRKCNGNLHKIYIDFALRNKKGSFRKLVGHSTHAETDVTMRQKKIPQLYGTKKHSTYGENKTKVELLRKSLLVGQKYCYIKEKLNGNA